MNEVVEAQVVEESSTELVAVPTANLFKTDDPAEVLRRAQETANALMPVVRAQNLTANIQGKEYLTVEAWQTLGAMLSVTPVCVWTHKLDNGWEARVEARTLDGRVIGAAEAECLTDEGRWKSADDFAVRSMAQTRATSKALASVLRFVATLGGAAGTPAEEVPREGFKGSAPVSTKQLDLFTRLLKEAELDSDALTTVLAFADDKLTGGREGTMSLAIDGLMDKEARAETVARLVSAAEGWTASQSDLPKADTRDLAPAA